MVKITFQSVAGQKVEKENDGDKSEILIPHAVVSVFLTRFISIIVREKKPACLSSAYRPTYTCAAMISWWGWGGGYMHVSHCELGAQNVQLQAAVCRALQMAWKMLALSPKTQNDPLKKEVERKMNKQLIKGNVQVTAG